MAAGNGDDPELGLVEVPVRRQNPAVLARVRIAQHDFLHIAGGLEQGAVNLVGEQRFQHRFAVAQIVHGLEQRRNG